MTKTIYDFRIHAKYNLLDNLDKAEFKMFATYFTSIGGGYKPMTRYDGGFMSDGIEPAHFFYPKEKEAEVDKKMKEFKEVLAQNQYKRQNQERIEFYQKVIKQIAQWRGTTEDKARNLWAEIYKKIQDDSSYTHQDMYEICTRAWRNSCVTSYESWNKALYQSQVDIDKFKKIINKSHV
jgi:hypothetical protein